MPRQARQLSASGIYHIMLRGINRQNIFEDEEDKDRFLQTLSHYKTVSGYQLYAYCLMSNHVHLLLKPEIESLDTILKRIAGSYVYWFNWKYKRSGHLFQDRFKSEPVNDDNYFLTVLRYIHQNPVKSGLCKGVADYRYSSYRAYLGESGIVDTAVCLEMITAEQFIEFNNEYSNEVCLDLEENPFRLTDEEAKRILQKISKCRNATEFQSLDLAKRQECLKHCRAKGISIRQLSRLTGISFGIIRKFG